MERSHQVFNLRDKRTSTKQVPLKAQGTGDREDPAGLQGDQSRPHTVTQKGFTHPKLYPRGQDTAEPGPKTLKEDFQP